jgi:hypothetical protein
MQKRLRCCCASHTSVLKRYYSLYSCACLNVITGGNIAGANAGGGGWDPFGTTAGHNAGANRPQVCDYTYS